MLGSTSTPDYNVARQTDRPTRQARHTWGIPGESSTRGENGYCVGRWADELRPEGRRRDLGYAGGVKICRAAQKLDASRLTRTAPA